MQEMRDIPQAEFDVMDVLWQKGEATTKELQEALSRDKKLAYTTIATLLSRLRDKGYVDTEERNFAYVFRPKIQREQVVRRKLDDLVKRILHGDMGMLVAYIADNRNLTLEQVSILEEIVKSDPTNED